MSNKPNWKPDEPDTPVEQVLPERPAPFTPAPGNIQFARCEPMEGQAEPIIVLVYDSPDARIVSYWGESAFLSMAQRMTTFVGEPAAHLTVADMSDLQALRDASPFEH